MTTCAIARPPAARQSRAEPTGGSGVTRECSRGGFCATRVARTSDMGAPSQLCRWDAVRLRPALSRRPEHRLPQLMGSSPIDLLCRATDSLSGEVSRRMMTTPDVTSRSPAEEGTHMTEAPVRDLAAITAERERIRTAHLRAPASRPASAARGLHHTALISNDVERTVRFYQDVLEFPLTELIENRDYPGSSHFFFDIGNGNLLAFFDFPGLDVGPYAEVLGGLHHVAISVEPERWQHLVGKLQAADVEHVIHSEVSVYFRDPDGARLELIADPLGEMYGSTVL